MDFRQLNCFVAVAEELHFGRAAMRLHMSQPPLSQQVKALETQLGVRLFERNRRTVTLSAAGEAFLQHVYEMLRTASAGAQAARRAASGEVGELRIGYSASALYSDDVLQAIVRYRRRYPAVEVRLVEGTTRSSAADLQAGRIDTAFVRGPLPQSVLAWPAEQRLCIAREPLQVALPRTHALAVRLGLSCEDLRDEYFIAMSRRLGTALNDLLDHLFEAARIRPRVALETTDMASLLGLVGAGAGIAIVPATVGRYRARHIVLRPLVDRGAEVELFRLLPARPVPTAQNLTLPRKKVPDR